MPINQDFFGNFIILSNGSDYLHEPQVSCQQSEYRIYFIYPYSLTGNKVYRFIHVVAFDNGNEL
jgi:hypothetical protein